MTATVTAVTREQVVDALEEVHDAHVPVSLRSMGMLADVQVDGDRVRVEMCIPCMACPAISFLTDQVRERVLAIDGVAAVDVEPGLHLPWDRDSVDERTRTLMRANGIQL